MYGFNSYYPPMDNLNQLKAQQQAVFPPWVAGINGAKNFPTAPNVPVLLMDSEQSRFFIKTTDQSGMPMPLRIFEFNEVTNSPATPELDAKNFVTREELQEILANLPTCKCKKKKEEVENEPSV